MGNEDIVNEAEMSISEGHGKENNENSDSEDDNGDGEDNEDIENEDNMSASEGDEDDDNDEDQKDNEIIEVDENEGNFDVEIGDEKDEGDDIDEDERDNIDEDEGDNFDEDEGDNNYDSNESGTSDESTHDKIVEDIKKGDTIVHYFYRGESSLSSALRSHHCSPSTLCMVLENKGVCKDSHLKCSTKYSCKGINCFCNIETSCGDEPKKKILTKLNYGDLRTFGATTVALQPEQKDLCTDKLCTTEISDNKDQVCKGSEIRKCETDVQCKEKCKCWVSLECEGPLESSESLGTTPARLQSDYIQDERDDTVYSYENASAKIPMPPLMFTEKLTLYIGRDPDATLDDNEWHEVAKEKCSDQAHRFDIGCSKKRTIDSRVFCKEKYCVCYVHYGTCKGYSFIESGQMDIKEEVVKSVNENGEDYMDDYELEKKMFESEKPDISILKPLGDISEELDEKQIDGIPEFEDDKYKVRVPEYGYEYAENYYETEENMESDEESDLKASNKDYVAPRKTFFQSHIYPTHLLENLKGGGSAQTYVQEETCNTRNMCPNMVFLCGDEKRGSCSARSDCNKKKEDGCLCEISVNCTKN